MRTSTSRSRHPLSQPHPLIYARKRKKGQHRGSFLILKATKRKLDEDDHQESVVQKNGVVRQAGAHPHQQKWMKDLKQNAEEELFIFTKSVLNRRYLTKSLHLPACRFLQTRRAEIDGIERDIFRKLLMFPRECGKTTMVSHALPLHIHIQQKANNIYFPGQEGCQQPIILAGETEKRVSDALGVMQEDAEGNSLLRALWPERFWPGPPRQHTKRWNATEMLLPRLPGQHLPDPSVRVLGVGAAVAGAHPRVLIKDDLVTFAASNSPTIMEEAIRWHVASRALVNRPGCLEFIIGTHWAVHDLYSYIEEHDNIEKGGKVWVYKKGLIEDGRCIFPKFTVEMNGVEEEFGFDEDGIEALRKEFGTLFPLMYMNTPHDASLTDFSEEQIRFFHVVGDKILFQEDERDLMLANMEQGPMIPTSHMKGQPLNEDTYAFLARRTAFLRARG